MYTKSLRYALRYIEQPILFLSGLQDELVPPLQMQMLHSKAIENNSDCRFVDFPNGMHMDTWYSGGDRYWRTIQLFLDQYVAEFKEFNANAKCGSKVICNTLDQLCVVCKPNAKDAAAILYLNVTNQPSGCAVHQGSSASFFKHTENVEGVAIICFGFPQLNT
ncbi:hypothetical protein ZIOFF_017099 [Zingiber officinale]|uniref:Peptidase S9 prolyl oligopeptidase catalytic domain-containing protein n=1 Tax=Zingiber officinale TaxID=94328 RepID=A0A8J5H6P2_ZINOF|nr:hypothetical protein ZIOFF_017099 [Zingiber officinale]